MRATIEPRAMAAAAVVAVVMAAAPAAGVEMLPGAGAWSTAVRPAPLAVGLASYYWREQATASGERFDRRRLTAAHRTLPFGTLVRVTHARNGRAVVVRINDRGPFHAGRIIDLSLAAAEQIGIAGTGIARVRLEVVR